MGIRAACCREQQRQAVLEWRRAREEQQRQDAQAQEAEALRRQERERQARAARQQELAGALAGFRQQKVGRRYQAAPAPLDARVVMLL